jgi:hypothetical protein
VNPQKNKTLLQNPPTKPSPSQSNPTNNSALCNHYSNKSPIEPKNTPKTVQKLTQIPEKQEKNLFSPSVYTKNTKNLVFRQSPPLTPQTSPHYNPHQQNIEQIQKPATDQYIHLCTTHLEISPINHSTIY